MIPPPDPFNFYYLNFAHNGDPNPREKSIEIESYF